MKITQGKYLLVFCSFLFFSCSQSRVSSVSEYLRWINKDENGLVRTKYVNGMEIKVKYLPGAYMALQEIQNERVDSVTRMDSILGLYKNSMNFLVSIGPDERKENGVDVMFQSVNTYKEFSQRVVDLNFRMEEYITLRAGSSEFKPVLSAMENVYGLKSSRDILFVFVPTNKEDNTFFTADKLDLLYEDGLFGLGDNHFVFLKKDIDRIPGLDLNKLKG